MGMNGPEPTAADYARAAAADAQSKADFLEKRIDRIEAHLGLPPIYPGLNPVEEAKIRDARIHGREYHG